jgi:DinB superfamily
MSPQPAMNEADLNTAGQYLAETRDSLLESVQGIEGYQWTFKPAPDRWSIAELVEHVGVTEEFFLRTIVPRLGDAPAAAPEHASRPEDADVRAIVSDESKKFGAPPQLKPTGRWAPHDALQHLVESRTRTMNFLNATPGLRGHIIPHPACGAIDGYQWVLLMAAHTARHARQILAVRADPNFPAN